MRKYKAIKTRIQQTHYRTNMELKQPAVKMHTAKPRHQ